MPNNSLALVQLRGFSQKRIGPIISNTKSQDLTFRFAGTKAGRNSFSYGIFENDYAVVLSRNQLPRQYCVRAYRKNLRIDHSAPSSLCDYRKLREGAPRVESDATS